VISITEARSYVVAYLGRTHVELFKKFITLLKTIDGKKSISEIADSLGMRRMTVSDYIEVLRELGLVEIEVTESIPRRRIPKLTERGKCFIKCFE